MTRIPPVSTSASVLRPQMLVKATSHRHAKHNKTVWSVSPLSRPLRLCELDTRHTKTQDCRQQKIWNLNTLIALSNSYPIHDTDKTVLSCLVWRWELIESARQATAIQVRSVSGLCRSVSGCAVRPPDALRRRTHLPGGQITPPHQTRQDCRARLSAAAAATQARQAATPSRPTALHTQRRCTQRKCKHCC